ncbi:Fructosamine-3-kinase [Pantoea agglomerans]|uniref:Fructosamine-3-kinase n=1 Tax=Enterobacter agglomerans TaxID=549 RepID=A0A379AHP2_ENTAG|nr:Fructosamine-3-kinase [Pantoea agglomerans]
MATSGRLTAPAVRVAPGWFDPACYWGDRECDLAMLSWYPDLPRQIYDGYQAVWPLPDGFSQRLPVYQLYYLLNRANVFGGHWPGDAQFRHWPVAG